MHNIQYKETVRALKMNFLQKAEAIDPAAGWIRLMIHGGRVNKAYNRCLITQQSGQAVGNSPGIRQ